jgi:hypothetical protein
LTAPTGKIPWGDWWAELQFLPLDSFRFVLHNEKHRAWWSSWSQDRPAATGLKTTHQNPHPMNTYDIHFFKTANLSPDEKNAMRRNAKGIWLVGGRITAESPRAACAAYRKSGQLGCNAEKLRAR